MNSQYKLRRGNSFPLRQIYNQRWNKSLFDCRIEENKLTLFSIIKKGNYGGSNQENTIRDDGLRVYHP